MRGPHSVCGFDSLWMQLSNTAKRSGMRGSFEGVEIIENLSFGGRYLSTTRKIALEDGRKCLTNSFRMQASQPGRGRESCTFGCGTGEEALVARAYPRP